MTNRVTGHGQTSRASLRSANMAQHRKAEQRRKRRQDGLRPLEIWLPAAMIEMIDGGTPNPTAESIAARAGVSLRTVWKTGCVR